MFLIQTEGVIQTVIAPLRNGGNKTLIKLSKKKKNSIASQAKLYLFQIAFGP